MRTVCYHLVHASGALAAGMGQTQVVRPGRLVGVVLAVEFYHAANQSRNAITANLNQNSVSNANVNNPAREETLATLRVSNGVGGGSAFGTTGFVPLNIPLQAGDLLTMNGTVSGSNATALTLSGDFYVQEA